MVGTTVFILKASSIRKPVPNGKQHTDEMKTCSMREHYIPSISFKRFQLESLIVDLKQLLGTVMPEQPGPLCKSQSTEGPPRTGLLSGHGSKPLSELGQKPAGP